MKYPLLLLIFLATLACYLATLTHVHTFDALSYVLDVDRKPWQELFHPHHLAYGPLGAIIRSVMSGLGWNGSAIIPLQVTNAFAGALGVTLFCTIIHDITHRVDLALCGAILLGGSYAYWYYAVEVEVYTIATCFLIICLWLVTKLLCRPTLQTYAALGIMQFLAIMFHQTNLLLCVPIGIVMLHRVYQGNGTWQMENGRWQMGVGIAAYFLPLALLTIGSYLMIGFCISNFASWTAFQEWLTAYAHTGWWGKPITTQTWVDLGKGVSETVAQPNGALLGLLLVGLLIMYLRVLIVRHHVLVLFLMTWIFSYGAFFVWWEPDNIEFWIASMPPAILLVLLALHASGPRWHPGVWVALAIGFTAFGTNYEHIVYRGNASFDSHRHIANQLAQQSQPEDLLVVSDGLLALYLPYYEGRSHAWSLNQALFESQGDWTVACASVQRVIHAALGRGAAVIIGERVVYPIYARTPFDDPLVGRFGLKPDDVTHCFAPFLPDVHPITLTAGLPTYYRLPSAQELANGLGWDFSRGSWGWQAVNIHNEQFGQGWEFQPGIDPQLISPPFLLDTTQYDGIELRIAASATTTATAKLELFFRNEDGFVDESTAIQRTLDRGFGAGNEHKKTYAISLAGRPGWQGNITGIRLDPIGEGDGGRMRVEWLRFIRKKP